MATKVRVPLYDANITEGVLNDWRKPVGATVERGEPLVDLITDKADFEVESPASGVLLAVTAEEKSTVPAGYIIAIIGGPGETPPDVADENRETLAEHLKKVAVMQALETAAGGAGTKESADRVRATPKARKLARDLVVDLAEVLKATGGTRVSEKDVEEFANRRKSG